MQSLGESAIEVWSKLVKNPDRFTSANTEALFGKFDTSQYPELRSWYEYITARYAWIIL